MANLTYPLLNNNVGTTRLVNPGRLYPQDLALMQQYEQQALANFCNQTITPGIVSNINPIFNSGSLAVAVQGTSFTISPGMAIFQDGLVFNLTGQQNFTLDVPATQDSSYVLVLSRVQVATATRYNTDLQMDETSELGWSFSFNMLPVGVYIPNSLLTSNMILLGQFLVDSIQQNYSLLYGDNATLSRPWFSSIDIYHRSQVGTGIVSGNNPHGLSINDLNSLPGLSFYEQQNLIGVISIYQGGPSHFGDFAQIYIPDAQALYIPGADFYTGSSVTTQLCQPKKIQGSWSYNWALEDDNQTTITYNKGDIVYFVAPDEIISSIGQTIQVNASQTSFTISSGSFLSQGFVVGGEITTSGFFNSSNNGQFLITSLTPMVMTCATATGLVNELTYQHITAASQTISVISSSSLTNPNSFIISSGSFLPGFAIGKQITTSGFTNLVNNGTFTITNVSDTILTVSGASLIGEVQTNNVASITTVATNAIITTPGNSAPQPYYSLINSNSGKRPDFYSPGTALTGGAAWLPGSLWTRSVGVANIPPVGIPLGADPLDPNGLKIFSYRFSLDMGAAHVLNVADAVTGDAYFYQYDRSSKTVTLFTTSAKPWGSNGLNCSCLQIYAGLVTQINGGNNLQIQAPQQGEYIVTPNGVVSTLQMNSLSYTTSTGALGTYEVMCDPSGMIYLDPAPLIQTNLFNISNQPAMNPVFLNVAQTLNIALGNFIMPTGANTFTPSDALTPFLSLAITGTNGTSGLTQQVTFQIYPISAADSFTNISKYNYLPENSTFLALDQTSNNLYVISAPIAQGVPGTWTNVLDVNSNPVTFTFSSSATVVQAAFTAQPGTNFLIENSTTPQWIQPLFPAILPNWTSITGLTTLSASAAISTYTSVIIQYPVHDVNSVPLASITISSTGSLLSLSDIRSQRIFFEVDNGEIFFEDFHNPLNFNPALTQYVGRGFENGIWTSRPFMLMDGTYRAVVVFDSYKDIAGQESLSLSYTTGLATLPTPILDSGAEIAPNKKIYDFELSAQLGYVDSPQNPSQNPTKFYDSWCTFSMTAEEGTRCASLYIENSVNQFQVMADIGALQAGLLAETLARELNDNNNLTTAENWAQAYCNTHLNSYTYTNSAFSLAQPTFNGTNVTWVAPPYTVAGSTTTFLGSSPITVDTSLGKVDLLATVSSNNLVTSSGSLTITVSASTNTFVIAGGTFGSGFVLGQTIVTNGFTNSGNNGTFVITGISSTSVACNGTLTNETNTSGATISSNRAISISCYSGDGSTLLGSFGFNCNLSSLSGYYLGTQLTPLLSVANGTGNTSILGSLNLGTNLLVGGSATVDGNLSVSGSGIFTGNLNATNQTLSGTLTAAKAIIGYGNSNLGTEIQFGTSGQLSSLGTQYTTGGTFLAFNATPVASSNNWNQSNGSDISSILAIDNSGLSFKVASSGSGSGFNFGTSIFSIDTSGNVIIGAGSSVEAISGETIQVSSSAKTFTITSGGTFGSGFILGNYITAAGFAWPGNNGTFVITAINGGRTAITCSTVLTLGNETNSSTAILSTSLATQNLVVGGGITAGQAISTSLGLTVGTTINAGGTITSTATVGFIGDGSGLTGIAPSLTVGNLTPDAITNILNRVQGITPGTPTGETTVQTTAGVPPGAIMAWPTPTAPYGWLLCNGASYTATPGSIYCNLFNAIGTFFGGSGTNFLVPDMRGLTIVGQNGSSFILNGTSGGSDTFTINSEDQLPSHHHFVFNTDTQVSAGVVGGNPVPVPVTATNYPNWYVTVGGASHGEAYAIGGSGTVPTWGLTSPTGASAPITLPPSPYMALNYIIKL